MTRPPASRRSLWLVPTGADAESLQRLLDAFGKSLGGPSFPPHVTLCSRIPEPAEAELELSELPLAVGLGALRFGDEYFHSCYLPLEPGSELCELQARSALAWRAARPAHAPHLSLFYGALDSARQDLARGLAQGAPSRVTLARCELWHTGGPVTGWHRLAASR